MPPARITTRQEAYLDAMDIGVWRLRENASEATHETRDAPWLKLGSGSGGVLLICVRDTDSASRLANDINRALGNVPVWAWPQEVGSGVELTSAIEEQLFTTVGIFGHELADRFFGSELPVSLHSAKVVLLPAMQDILDHAKTRRRLWDIFCRSGMIGVRDNNA